MDLNVFSTAKIDRWPEGNNEIGATGPFRFGRFLGWTSTLHAVLLFAVGAVVADGDGVIAAGGVASAEGEDVNGVNGVKGGGVIAGVAIFASTLMLLPLLWLTC